jgi:peptidoglycan hydrolase-like protein with peptidoglycan-binding domain
MKAMTTRKRKPPEKRRSGRASRLVSGSASLIGTAMMRNPAATGGTAIFMIVFSFVAANALWYQPEAHPHPWLDTRHAFEDYAANAMNLNGEPVTTFKVERDVRAAAAIPAPAQTPAPRPAPAVVVQDPANAATAAAAPALGKSELVAAIQSNLARRGLYDGAVDGVKGPMTQAAIIFYQETRGLPETGNPDQAILDLLKKDNAEFSVLPAERPTPDVTGAIVSTAGKAPDPVAALIEKAPVPKAAIPVAKPAATPAAKAPVQAASVTPVRVSQPAAAPSAPALSGNLVMQIQKGLSNLAYKDVTVDGVAGQQTREAIRHFQKHYRLPETGNPDQAVLDKLKKIGAL